MKRVILVFSLLILVILSTSCEKKKEMVNYDSTPKTSQMKAICELATMKCFYHNVAKYKEEDAEGMWFWSKDKKFWIEYSGIVTIGVDATQLQMNIEGNKVIITMPKATVFEAKVDENSLTKDSFHVDTDSATPNAEDQKKAFQKAQSDMLIKARNDEILLANAQEKAKLLLSDYVTNISEVVGKKYTVEWKEPKAE